MRRIALVLLSLVGAAPLACGGGLASDLFEGAGDGGPTDGGGGDGSTLDGSAPDGAGSDGGGSNDGGRGAACPASLPSQGTPCPRAGLACEYGGTGDHLLCSTFATCQSLGSSTSQVAWSIRAPDARCSSSQASNSSLCPLTFGGLATGSACPLNLDATCVYPQGECGCVPCESGSGPGKTSTEWACEAWPVPQGCPEPRPRIGTACATDGQTCFYGSPCGVTSSLPAIGCRDGAWGYTPFAADCAIRLCGR